jgi:hypothetical protein
MVSQDGRARLAVLWPCLRLLSRPLDSILTSYSSSFFSYNQDPRTPVGIHIESLEPLLAAHLLGHGSPLLLRPGLAALDSHF